jgi:hypothetical protein
MVICTHWHDDHIRGLSSILSACPKARFLCSSSLKESAFLELVALGETIRGNHSSGLREFSKILKQIQLRRQQQKPASLETCYAGTHIMNEVRNGANLRIEALSPSKHDHQRMAVTFAKKKNQLTSGDFKRNITSIHPNLGSVVIRLELGEQAILLGADMEVRNSEDSGWKAILSTYSKMSAAGLYKIAHHGSENGDMSEIWSTLLVEDCFAILTSNQRLQNPLPKPADVKRIVSNTTNAFASSPANIRKTRLEQPADRLLRSRGILIYDVPSSQGHIRARHSTSTGGKWQVELYGKAFKLIAQDN